MIRVKLPDGTVLPFKKFDLGYDIINGVVVKKKDNKKKKRGK